MEKKLEREERINQICKEVIPILQKEFNGEEYQNLFNKMIKYPLEVRATNGYSFEKNEKGEQFLKIIFEGNWEKYNEREQELLDKFLLRKEELIITNVLRRKGIEIELGY